MPLLIEDDNTFTVGDNSILGLESLDQDGNAKPFDGVTLIFDTVNADPLMRTETDAGMTILSTTTAQYDFQAGELAVGLLKFWWRIRDSLGNVITQPLPGVIEVVADPAG